MRARTRKIGNLSTLFANPFSYSIVRTEAQVISARAREREEKERMKWHFTGFYL